ncbi:phosphotransferase family protein [soil metagenome]
MPAASDTRSNPAMAKAQPQTAVVHALDSPEAKHRIESWLLIQCQARRLAVTNMTRLSGGAIQENWALTVAVTGGLHTGEREWVLRTDAASAVAASLGRAQEFAVLQVVHEAGMTVPQPLWLCTDPGILDREFFIMEKISGVAAGHRLTRDANLVPDPAALGEALGANLARLHTIRPPEPRLDFLPAAQSNHALAAIADYRAEFDLFDDSFPALEWGLRWCELNAPAPMQNVLIHRDYRTGNYMVHDGQLTGVLDWEFTGWGDPREDIGWFMARCWRFSRPDRIAGGVADAADFLRGYAKVSGTSFTLAEIKYWQVMAHLRWAVIALQQEARHLSGREPSLELALTGRLVADLEFEILRLTGNEFVEGGHA